MRESDVLRLCQRVTTSIFISYNQADIIRAIALIGMDGRLLGGSGAITILQSSIVDNDSPNPFGNAGGLQADGSVTVSGTLFANNGNGDCNGDGFTDGGHNFAGDGSCGLSGHFLSP